MITNELLSLAQSIQRQCGRYTAISVHIHDTDSVVVAVSVCTGHDAFDWMRGGAPGEMTLDELHNAMKDYIITNRKVAK